MFQVPGSESMNTGRALQYRIGLQLPTKVSDEQNTVSPGCTPSSSRPRWMAAVPELSAAA